MAWQDMIFSIIVLIAIFLLIYSKIRNQSIPEILREFKEMITPSGE